MATKDETKDIKPKATVVKDDADVVRDPLSGEPLINEPDATGSTSGIPPVGPTDMDGDGEPDAGLDEQDEIRKRYQDEVDARTEDAQRRGSQSPTQGPEQRRRVASLAEALYPDENVSDEAKEAVAPKADASHA